MLEETPELLLVKAEEVNVEEDTDPVLEAAAKLLLLDDDGGCEGADIDDEIVPVLEGELAMLCEVDVKEDCNDDESVSVEERVLVLVRVNSKELDVLPVDESIVVLLGG